MKNLGVRVTGFLIFLLSLTGMIATILLSIAKNITDLSNITLANLAYIFTVCFAGLAIFSANCYITAIRKQYYSHYNKIVFLRTGLLVFMVYNNYHFFMANMQISTTIDKAMYFILCVLIDFGIITLLPFAFDRMLLNYTYKNTRDDDISTISKLVNILFFRWKLKIDLQYQKNLQIMNNPVIDIDNQIKVKEVVEEKQIESKLKLLKFPVSSIEQNTEDNSITENTEIKHNTQSKNESTLVLTKTTENENDYENDSEIEDTSTLCSTKDLEIVKNAIFENMIGNVSPSIPRLTELTGLKRHVIQLARTQLKKEGLLSTLKTKTYINVED
jgi:hypothetical protein